MALHGHLWLAGEAVHQMWLLMHASHADGIYCDLANICMCLTAVGPELLSYIEWPELRAGDIIGH